MKESTAKQYFEERVSGVNILNPKKFQKIWTNTLLSCCVECRIMAVRKNRQKIEPKVEDFCDECRPKIETAIFKTEQMIV